MLKLPLFSLYRVHAQYRSGSEIRSWSLQTRRSGLIKEIENRKINGPVVWLSVIISMQIYLEVELSGKKGKSWPRGGEVI